MHNIENVKKKHLNILKDDFWEYDRVVSSSKRVSPRFGVQRLEYSNRRTAKPRRSCVQALTAVILTGGLRHRPKASFVPYIPLLKALYTSSRHQGPQPCCFRGQRFSHANNYIGRTETLQSRLLLGLRTLRQCNPQGLTSGVASAFTAFRSDPEEKVFLAPRTMTPFPAVQFSSSITFSKSCSIMTPTRERRAKSQTQKSLRLKSRNHTDTIISQVSGQVFYK